jgi:cohesin loading factor subunit SCC2
VLGCVCRYYKFKPLERLLVPASRAGPLPKELNVDNIYEASYRLFSGYLAKDVDTEVQAVQAICSLFTGCMQLMLTAQRDGIIGRIMRSKENLVKLTGLRSFREVLTAEERRVESGAARESMAKSGVTLQQRVKGDQDAEASIVGGVIQEHLETIMHLLLDRDHVLRSTALALLSVLHRQGLVNPLQTMPTLLALQGDPSPAVRGDAYRQILIETEKHPEYISNRAMDGLCLSYSFQKSKLERVSTRMDEKDSSANGTQCIFGPVYASSIRSNRKYRFQFLRNLLALFEEKTANEQHALAGRQKKQEQLKARMAADGVSAAYTSATQKGSLDPEFLAYAARIIAYLPFEVQEEPLFVIYHISRLISLEGSALLSELKSLFQRAGLKLGDETGEKKDADDDDSDDEPTKGPGQDGATAMDVDEDGPSIPPALLSTLKDKCAACMAFCALLRLKFFLKNVYHLNDDKCLEYKPQEGGIKGERPLTKPDVLPDLDLPDNLIVCLSGDGPEVARTLKLQYQEFNRLIRGDPADFKLHKPVRSSKGRRSSAGANGNESPTRPPRGGKRPSGGTKKKKTPVSNGKRGGRQSSGSRKKRKVEESSDDEEEAGDSTSSSEESSSDDE